MRYYRIELIESCPCVPLASATDFCEVMRSLGYPRLISVSGQSTAHTGATIPEHSTHSLTYFCFHCSSLFGSCQQMENFRTPNFELVADILHWLTRKYDNEAGISDRIESVDDRVTFLTQIVQVSFALFAERLMRATD